MLLGLTFELRKTNLRTKVRTRTESIAGDEFKAEELQIDLDENLYGGIWRLLTVIV